MPVESKSELLLGLLGRALFGRETVILSDTDWDALALEACQQAVHLLVFDCLTDAERAALPPETEARWRRIALSSLWQNERVAAEQQRILSLLKQSGIPCVVLKGSSSAMHYPKPELRCAGDIDLLLPHHQIPRAQELLLREGYTPPQDSHPFHRSLCRDGLVTELHFEPPGLPQGDIGDALRQYFRAAEQHAVLLDGLPVLPPEQQAVLLLLHKLEHIVSSGLGLRQLCDWAVFVHRELTAGLWETLEPLLRQWGLLRFARIVTRICVEALSLPAEDAPWCMEADEAVCHALLLDILHTGNFGCKENRYGQRLFTDAQSGNRLTSFFRVGLDTCRTHWPVCREHPVLLPAAPFVLTGRYLCLRREGKRAPFRPLAVFQGAGERQQLYQALRPFLPEEDPGTGSAASFL